MKRPADRPTQTGNWGAQPPALAEMVWIAVAVLALGAFVANIPVRYEQLLAESQGNAPALARLGLRPGFYVLYFLGFEILGMLAFALTAVVIFWRRSDDWMTVFVALTLLTFGAAVPSQMHALVTIQPLGGWLGLFVQSLGTGSFLVFFYLFLDGKFIPRWTGALTVLVAAWVLAWPFFPALNPYTWRAPLPLLVFAVWYGTGVYAQFYRYRRISTPEQRQQTKWVVFGLTMAVLGDFVTHLPKHVVPALGQPGLPNLVYLLAHQPAFTFSQMLVPATILISTARYRLWDIDLIIRRTLVYGLLTASVIGSYALVVGTLSALFSGRGSLWLSILATGLAAALIQPLRQRLQRGVNRLLYGEVDDPATALAQLGQRLESAAAPEAVLPSITETVAQALKVPYVAVEMMLNGHPWAVSHGQPPGTPADLLRLPVVYQSEPLGQLLVAARSPGEAFTPGDWRLLEAIARQAGPALHSVRLTADLQRSRERLVAAREEERRRLRRDLHDGLGPTLASQTFKLDAALDLLESDPARARTLLQELKAQTQATVGDIRRLVYDLRPPALDELGLTGALAQAVQRHQGGGAARFFFEAPSAGLPPLPAAVEAAAYRIALEAVTNVVRHAGARECRVSLGLSEHGALSLEVLDDGRGLPPEARPGVGLASMRERAAEVGGVCRIETRPEGGTRVSARLPLS